MTIQPGANVYTQGFGSRPENVEVPHIDVRAPASTDVNYPVGKKWVYTNNATYELLGFTTSNGAVTANWVVTAGSAGDLNQLTGDTGTALPSAGSIKIAGSNTITTTGSGSTVTLTSTSAGYPITPYVVGPTGKAGYQTVQSAVTAANAAGGGTVFVQPGTYTENLTLYSNVNIVGTIEANTTIIGVHTPPTSGNFAFQNINLQSATHIFSSTAAGTASLLVELCTINITSGYLFNLLNWTGTLSVFNSGSLIGNDGFVKNTGGATVIANSANVGFGSSNPFTISGAVSFQDVVVVPPGTFEGSGIIDTSSCVFLGTVTTAGSVTTYLATATMQPLSSTAAISHGSSNKIVIDESIINSSATNVIAGSGTGTVYLGNVSFDANSGIASTLSVTYNPVIGRITPYVVGPSGTFTTIQSAVTAANAAGGGTVFVQPGTYTENLTLHSGVNIVGTVYGNTTITGVHTPPTSGSFVVQNCTLTSATHIFSSAASGTSILTIEDCITNVTNGYTYNLANWTGQLGMYNTGSIGTNDGVVNNTGGATIEFISSTLGTGTGNTFTYGGGTCSLQAVILNCPITIQTGANLIANQGTLFNNTLTTANNATATLTECYFNTGATAAISHGSSGAISLSTSTITSSNNPAIAGSGAGTLTITGVDFTSNSAISGSLTLAYGASKTGSLTVNGNLTFGTAGNKIVSSSVATTTTAGANSFGSVTLSSGTATVATTAVTANSLIFIWRQSPGSTGAAALGELSVGTITAGTSFVINALTTANSTVVLTTDVSVVGWMIIN